VGLEIVEAVSLTAFLLFLLVTMVHSVMREEHVTGNTLCRAVSVYLLLGVAWSIMFGLVLHLDGGAFSINVAGADGFAARVSGSSLLYLSFCTLTTLGYGDITPISPIAQGLAMIEATLGPLYLAILVARLVAIYTRERPA
ncbi:MAG: potassium channel family protein, partial [Phycisphaerae bacterium]|nr:potassium channel family protein [Phycisphaerae bacterium]